MKPYTFTLGEIKAAISDEAPDVVAELLRKSLFGTGAEQMQARELITARVREMRRRSEAMKPERQLIMASVNIQDVDKQMLPLPEDGLLKVNDVLKYIRASKSVWLAWVRTGVAPRPVKIGCNTFWRGRDLRLFIAGGCNAQA